MAPTGSTADTTKPPSGVGPTSSEPSKKGHPLAHPGQAVPGPGTARWPACDVAGSIGHAEPDRAQVLADRHRDRGAGGMPPGVRQRLLHDAVRADTDAGGHVLQLRRGAQLDGHPGPLRRLNEHGQVAELRLRGTLGRLVVAEHAQQPAR
jgi:hypothetical protein